MVSRRLRTDEPARTPGEGLVQRHARGPGLRQEIGRVAFARVDCDLYQSAVECLDFLEGRLSDGAFLCFDDWTDDPNTGETRAFLEFADRTRDRYIFRPVCRISLGGMHMRVHHA